MLRPNITFKILFSSFLLSVISATYNIDDTIWYKIDFQPFGFEEPSSSAPFVSNEGKPFWHSNNSLGEVIVLGGESIWYRIKAHSSVVMGLHTGHCCVDQNVTFLCLLLYMKTRKTLPGKWVLLHPGVNAPGTPKTTTFFPAQREPSSTLPPLIKKHFH